jgi:carboxymethylenebutenolidase
MTNALAAELGDAVQAGAPYYGEPAASENVDKIKAELVIHFAENDPRINTTWAAYESGLKTHGVKSQAHFYAGTQHGFHNNSTPRFNQAAADLSWSRTLELFNRTLKT